MEKKKAYSSYIDTLSSGFDAKNVDGEQVGLAHEQEVAPENNWGNDKRDAIGRAAYLANKKKRLAKKLYRISRELEAIGKMEEPYAGKVDEMEEDPMSMEMGTNLDEEKDPNEKEPDNDEDDINLEAKEEKWLDPNVDADKEASVVKEAIHPIQHDPNKDDPTAFAPSDMGDAEWISIGPGVFDDKRDPVGKAAK
jgi:hypothetical protein